MGGSGVLIGDTPQRGVVFADTIRWVLDAEGGARLVNDPGGLTKWGLSQKAFPDLDIKNLTREQAEDIYFESYWKPIKANALPAVVAFVTFDAAVNTGVVTATKLLQMALGSAADGVMGPTTISAAKTFTPRQELVALVIGERVRWYEALARSKPVYQQYLRGWRLCCVRLAMEAGRWRSVQ